MPKISVIIPVYNVEKVIGECLDSVCSQSFSDIQIICVNDCSTDKSGLILNMYAKRDSRISVINNEQNLGAGLSRNTGLKYAEGEYVHFLDSDDWLEKNAYEILAANIVDSPDIVSFLMKKVYTNSDEIRLGKFKYNFETTNIIDNPLLIEDFGMNPWQRIYRKDFLLENHIVFDDYRCMEDVEFSYKAAIKADKIKFINDYIYNYRRYHNESLSGKAAAFYDCIIKTYKVIYEYSKCLPASSREIALATLLNSVIYNLLGSFVFGYLSLKELKFILKQFDYDVFSNEWKTYKWFGMYNEIMNSDPFSIKLKYRLKLFLKNNCYKLYEKLKNAHC